MAFITVHDQESGAPRTFNSDYVIYVEKDGEGDSALIWWVSYADPGQPRSKWFLSRETYDEVRTLLSSTGAA